MQTTIFTLCDGAFNYDGRLTIVGVYDQIRMMAIPGMARVSYAVKFMVPMAEVPTTIRIDFLDQNGNPISAGITKSIAPPPSNAESINLAMVGTAQLNVAEAGKHKMVCSFGDQRIGELEFSIVVV